MKTILILFGCIAIAAGFGVNWMNLFDGDGNRYSDRTNDYDDRIKQYPNYKDMMIRRKLGGHDTNVGRDSLNVERMAQPDLKKGIMEDKDIMQKQKFILDVLRNIYTTHTNTETGDYSSYVEGETNYVNHDRVAKFFEMCHVTTTRHCLLQRGRVFNILDPIHQDQILALFNLFYCSKDFEIFRRNVLWARNCINEDMFVQALTVAIFHRRDMIGVKLPSHYEIVPHKFHTSTTVMNAISRKLDSEAANVVVVKSDYTSDIQMMDDEGQLAYLTEDIGWNLFHFYYFMAYPFWLGGEDLGFNRQHRGETYLYIIQQLLARYYMERLSHRLGDIDEISLHVPIRTGYNPHMIHNTGLGYTMRRNYYDIYSTGDFQHIVRIKDYERRLRDAIDYGFCTGKDGNRVDLMGENGVNILGSLIQSNADSVNNDIYGGIIQLFRTLLGGARTQYADRDHMIPTVMDSSETAFRDPATYQIYKRVWKLFYQYKNKLEPYTTTELLVNGVRIEDVYTTKLVTYFDKFDVDITNIVDHENRTHRGMNTVDRIVLARHNRLNHKPFTTNFDVVSDRAQKVVIRIFLGPKYNHIGQRIHLNDNRDNFVEWDKFVYDLPVGRTTIKRESREFAYTVPDRTTYVDLYKKILQTNDLNKLLELNIVETHCGFPDRLLLPRGWNGGMPMQLFVIITQATNAGKYDDVINRCARNINWFRVDNFVLGFPFDRRINEDTFYTTNMLFKDVLIYHEGPDTQANSMNMMMHNTNTMHDTKPIHKLDTPLYHHVTGNIGYTGSMVRGTPHTFIEKP